VGNLVLISTETPGRGQGLRLCIGGSHRGLSLVGLWTLLVGMIARVRGLMLRA
jgi:hypothetical protein